MFEKECTSLETTILATYGISLSHLSDNCIGNLEDIVTAYSNYYENSLSHSQPDVNSENIQTHVNQNLPLSTYIETSEGRLCRNSLDEGKLLTCWNAKQLELAKLELEVSRTKDDIASIRREVQTVRNTMRNSKFELKIIEDEETAMNSGTEDKGSCSSLPFMQSKMANYAKKSKEYRMAHSRLNAMMKDRKNELEEYSHESLLEKSKILKQLCADSEDATEKRLKYLDLSPDPEEAMNQLQQARLNLQKLEYEFEQKVADFAI